MLHDVGGGTYSGPEPRIQVPNDIHGYCCPFFIWEVAHLTSKVYKGFLDGVRLEVNEGNEHDFFIGMQYVIRSGMLSMKIFGFIF